MKKTNNVISSENVKKQVANENVLAKQLAHERLIELSTKRRLFEAQQKKDNENAKKHFNEMFNSISKAAKILYRYSFKEDSAVQAVCIRELNVSLETSENDFVAAVLEAVKERTKFRCNGKIVEKSYFITESAFRFDFYKVRNRFSPSWINSMLIKSVIRTYEVDESLVFSDKETIETAAKAAEHVHNAEIRKAEKAAAKKAEKAEKAEK